MKLPELPEPLFWSECGEVINHWHDKYDNDYENVAWFIPPNTAENYTERWLAYSAPVGLPSNTWHTVYADTEEEAINLIVTFALLGVTKDG